MTNEASTAPTADLPKPPDKLSQNHLFTILSNRRRRYTVHFLKQVNDAVSVRELAEQVAAWENGKSKDELTSQERKRVYISLYQGHLSTLAEEGLVEYDSDRGLVSPTDLLVRSDIYLEIVPPNTISWGQFYIGLTVANLFLLALAWYEVGILADVPDLLLAAAMLGSYAVTAIVQTLRTERLRLGEDGPPPDLREDASSRGLSLDFDLPTGRDVDDRVK